MRILTPLERSKLPTNDLGNARRIHDAAAGRLLWLADGHGGKGCWVAFDGVIWSADEGPTRAEFYAQKAAQAIGEEVAALRDSEDDELRAVWGPKFTREMADKRMGELYAWAVKSGDGAKISGALGRFKALRDGDEGPFVAQAWMRDFDADPYAYHVKNGTVRHFQHPDGTWAARFDAGHDPADRFMQVADNRYDADARCPEWEKRLEVMHHDPVQRTALQRIYGMGLTQLISDQAFYIFQGKGQDGKSATNDVICKLHGAYARKADPKTFLEGPAQSSSSHQSDIVRLAGDIRLVVCDEPKKGAVWDGQRIKQATGSEMIARGAHAATELSFTPHWQLVFECNGLPRAPSDDRGFRRRFKLYPWVVQFGVTPGVPDEPVHLVKERLLAEGPGILNWMIQGCIDWLNERVIPEPEMARRATASFWEATSAMGEWIEKHCDLSDPEAREPATDLYQHYRQFCIDRGEKEEFIMNQTGFGRALNNAQIYAVDNHRTGKRDRVGIRLKRDGAAAEGADAGDPRFGSAASTAMPPWPESPDFNSDDDPFARGAL